MRFAFLKRLGENCKRMKLVTMYVIIKGCRYILQFEKKIQWTINYCLSSLHAATADGRVVVCSSVVEVTNKQDENVR